MYHSYYDLGQQIARKLSKLTHPLDFLQRKRITSHFATIILIKKNIDRCLIFVEMLLRWISNLIT